MYNILCFGDSNTWGFDGTKQDVFTGRVERIAFELRWPGVAQKALGSQYRIIEDALNGRTIMTEDPYFPRRLGMDSLETALDAHAPLDLVAIQLGANELKHMFNLSAGMIAFGLERMVLEVKKSCYGYPPPKILIIAPSPVRRDIDKCIFGFSMGPLAYGKSCELGALYEEIARRHGCGFIDCADLDFELNSVDGLHYSPGDHQKLGTAAAAKISEMLKP